MTNIWDHLTAIFKSAHPAIVIECGAAVGNDTELIREAAGGDSCRYFAIEPDPRNAADFRIRHHGNPVTFIQAAIGERCGIATFRGSFPYEGSGSIKVPREHLTAYPDITFPKELECTVPIVTLDDIFQSFALARVDFIWADVQGAEDLLIAGGQEALKSTRWFYTEFYDSEMYAGQIPLEEIHRRLPGEWELVQQWENDALFRNKRY